MKILSFAIPCYNSADYMEKCIKSVLTGGEDVVVIIVDDGSMKDNTFEIAKKYEAKYPTIVKAIHQENGGHGEAVNTGLRNATGKYFKVVDSRPLRRRQGSPLPPAAPCGATSHARYPCMRWRRCAKATLFDARRR